MREGRLPRILVALIVAVSLHGVLLLGNETGSASPRLSSPTLAIRFISTPAQEAAPTVADARAPVSTGSAMRPIVAPPPSSDAPQAAQGTPGKAARPSRPAEPPNVTSNAREVAPVAATSPAPPPVPAAPALASAPDYLTANLLTVGPRPLQDIEPDYPEAANLRSGKVVLRLLISDTGHVDEAAVVRAAPPGLFDASAIEAFSKARFSPGLAAGIAVKSQITVEVDFVPLNRLSRISGRSY